MSCDRIRTMSNAELHVEREDVLQITRTVVESNNPTRVGLNDIDLGLVWNILRSDPTEARPGTANVHCKLPLGRERVPSSLTMYVDESKSDLAKRTASLPKVQRFIDRMTGETIERKIEIVPNGGQMAIDWS